MADDFEVVDEASSTTASGAYKALTPLQRKANNLRPLPSRFTEDIQATQPEYKKGRRPSQLKQDVEDSTKLQETQVQVGSPLLKAYGAALEESIPARLYRAAVEETASSHVDSAYDSGSGRYEFMSKYGEEHLPEYDSTVNAWQRDQLIEKIDNKRENEALMGESLVGSGLGGLADPTYWITGGGALKAAVVTARAYRIGKAGGVLLGGTLEGASIGGIEAGTQVSEFGRVYDTHKVGEMAAISAAMHFGIGSITPKAAFEYIPKTPETAGITARKAKVDAALAAHSSGDPIKVLDKDSLAKYTLESKQLGNSLETLGEAHNIGNGFVQQARKELAAIGQKRAEELGAGALIKPAETRMFPEHTYPDPKPDELVPDEAIVDAGSAANKTRKDATAEVVIKSESDKINDNIESARIADKANKDQVGQKTYDWLDSPIGKVSALFSNSLRALKSKSEVVRTHALILGADSTGLFRAIEHGTAYDKVNYNELIRNHHSYVHDEYKAWLKRTGKGGYFAAATGKNEIAFNKALRAEMEARWNSKDLSLAEQKMLDEARWKSLDPEFKRAADALDAGNQAALDLMKKYNVLGAEGLNPISRGYVSRRMDGDALRNLFSKSPKEFAQVQEAFGNRYFESFQGMQKQAREYITANIKTIIKEDLDARILELQRKFKGTPEALAKATKAIKPTTLKAQLDKVIPITKDKAKTIARGVMERALNKSAGVDGTTVGLLDRAARDEMRNILESKGMDFADIEHTFNLLDKRLGSKSGSNRLKGRMEIDIATPDKETGISFMDYFDNDLNRLTSSYAEEMSGRIALARQGISTDNDFENIIQAAKNSHTGNAQEVADDIQLLRDMYAQLLGRPLEGQGRSKFVQFLTNLNPLQTLGQVGVAQGTESSLSVARLGVGAALKAIPMFAKVLVGARKGMVDAADKVLLKDIEAWVGPVGEAWRTHRPLTEVMERLNANGEVAHMADRMLKAGQHVNGFVSMMHQMMETQLKIVAIQGSRTFAKEIKAGVLTKRIADAGFSKETMASIKRELDAHAVFKDGELYDMQLGKWSHDNADHFTRNIQRISGQLIQKDFAGETASWMHKDMGRMLLSLRGYSIKAFNKQLVRNVAMHDAVAAQSVVYGLAFSTLGYTAKTYAVAQMREDKEQFLEDRLSGNAFIQGAVGYMALGAFGPELIRPLLSWNAEAGEAGAIKSGGNALVALIPGLSPLNRLMQDVDAVGSSVVGDTDWSSKKTRHVVQSALGNSFPIAFGVNAMVDDNE